MTKIKYLVIAMGLVLVMGLIGFKLMTGKAVESQNSEIKEFTVKAFKFGYSPDIIEVNKGDKVRIIIENTDTTHGIRIPDLNLKDNNQIEFTTDKQGEFIWYCTNICGDGHSQMRGKLIVK